MMKIITGGVTAAKGFEAAATAAKIKYQDRTDMAMIYSQVPCVCAGTFTTNVVKAACVKWDQQIVAGGQKAQAVIVNSGIANACTGAEGFGYCKETADAAAEALGISADGVLIGSTGVIGKQLPIDRIKAGVKALAQKKNTSLENGTEAAKAIMTTDTCEKQIAVEIEVGGKTVTIGGMAKGSGMIHPNMCTMLSFITTDAVITKEALQKALSDDVNDTYNMISVDGDTSTNDTVVLLANGLAENEEITVDSPDYPVFYEALHTINEYLAKKIGCAVGGKCGIAAVIILPHTGKFGMRQLLGHAAENVLRTHAPAHEKYLLFVVIQGTHIVGQGNHRLNGNGSAVDQGFQQHPVIQLHSRGRAHPPSGLGHIVDPLYLKGGSPGAVLPVIFLTGFQNLNTFGFPLDRHPGLLPAVEVLP